MLNLCWPHLFRTHFILEECKEAMQVPGMETKDIMRLNKFLGHRKGSSQKGQTPLALKPRSIKEFFKIFREIRVKQEEKNGNIKNYTQVGKKRNVCMCLTSICICAVYSYAKVVTVIKGEKRSARTVKPSGNTHCRVE